jgi:hypothetical protein
LVSARAAPKSGSTLRVSGANENGQIRERSDSFAGRFDTVSPRAPRSGPAPKVHWSMSVVFVDFQ